MADHHHDHYHQHQDSAAGGKDFAQANKEHFDAQAHSQPDPRWIQMAKKASQAIRANYDFSEESTVVMDFACNIGLTSRELAPYARTIVGVDISQAAVDVFNETVSNQGIEPEEMRAVCVELKGEEGELDGLKFDAITCVLSYHHFEDIHKITRVLSFFLKPGGALLVVDFVKPDSTHESEPLVPEEYAHVVPHTHGITKEGAQAALEGAGLVDFIFKPIATVTMHEKEMVLFLAKATKASPHEVK